MVHESFQTVDSQLNWESPMYKLWEKAKKNGKWDPAEIDFTQDKIDYENMTDDERITILPLVASFAGGEEAVTLDILPMVQLMARQGRLEDTMFLSTFMFDEAKHTELFSRWQKEIGIQNIDLTSFHGDSYKRIFYEELPEKMERLNTDDSPEAIIIHWSVNILKKFFKKPVFQKMLSKLHMAEKKLCCIDCRKS